MADNNDDLRHRMEAQEQAIKVQQEALNNIQLLLGQLLVNKNLDASLSQRDRLKRYNLSLPTGIGFSPIFAEV